MLSTLYSSVYRQLEHAKERNSGIKGEMGRYGVKRGEKGETVELLSSGHPSPNKRIRRNGLLQVSESSDIYTPKGVKRGIFQGGSPRGTGWGQKGGEKGQKGGSGPPPRPKQGSEFSQAARGLYVFTEITFSVYFKWNWLFRQKAKRAI